MRTSELRDHCKSYLCCGPGVELKRAKGTCFAASLQHKLSLKESIHPIPTQAPQRSVSCQQIFAKHHPVHCSSFPPTQPESSQFPSSEKPALTKRAGPRAGMSRSFAIKTHHSQTLRFFKDTLSCHLHNRICQNRWSTLPWAVYANTQAKKPWAPFLSAKSYQIESSRERRKRVE